MVGFLVSCLAVAALAAEGDPAADEPADADQEEAKVVATKHIKLQRGGQTFDAYATVSTGEDAAIGAWRLAEQYAFHDTPTILGIVASLQASIDELDPPYEVPKEITHCGKRACSAGKFKARAEAARKAELYDDMGADLLRALSRKGLEEQIKERLQIELGRAFDGIKRQRQREEEDRKVAEKKEEHRLAGEAAMAEALARKELDEEDWATFERGVNGDAPAAAEGADAAADEAKTVAEVTLTISSKSDGQETGKREATATLVDGQHAAEASFDFCEANDIHNHAEVTKIAGLLSQNAALAGYLPPPLAPDAAAEPLIAQANKHRSKGSLKEAGALFSQVLHDFDATLTPEAKGELQKQVHDVFGAMKSIREFQKVFLAHDYEGAVKLLGKITSQDRNADLMLMAARCYQQLGRNQDALQYTAVLIQKAASHSKWVRGQPRMMAVTLGANAAMEIGNTGKALKFYASVLKYDPEQKEVRLQHRGLKKVVKLLKKADEQLEKGYNLKASEILEELMIAMRGLDVDSPLFRSEVQLKQCRVQSGMGKHEDAIENCDSVVEQRSTVIPGLFVTPVLRSEAYKARAAASMKDLDYEQAVSDLKASLEGIEGGEKLQELHQLLREAEHKKKQWDGDENRRMPPQRDHIKILDLPINLPEASKEVKCSWLKKQYKKNVLKWHPDKYKGNAKRGERKMRHVNESREHLAQQWGCKGGRKRNNDDNDGGQRRGHPGHPGHGHHRRGGGRR